MAPINLRFGLSPTSQPGHHLPGAIAARVASGHGANGDGSIGRIEAWDVKMNRKNVNDVQFLIEWMVDLFWIANDMPFECWVHSSFKLKDWFFSRSQNMGEITRAAQRSTHPGVNFKSPAVMTRLDHRQEHVPARAVP